MARAERPQVGVVTGSENDWEVMEKAGDVLDEFQVVWEAGIKSAHRTPDRMRDYGLRAKRRGLQTIIAGAGGSAALPGMLQSYTRIPVIGVPIVSTGESSLKRESAL